MGRPIKKNTFLGNANLKIQATSYRFTGQSEAASPAGQVLRQKGTYKFIIGNGTANATMKLSTAGGGNLANATFRIEGLLANGAVAQIQKLKNRTATIAGGGQFKLSKVAETAITGITQAANAIVTANGHGIANGSVVSFKLVGGMTQINNTAALILSVQNANAFTVNTNSSAFSAYTSGGRVSVAPATGGIAVDVLP